MPDVLTDEQIKLARDMHAVHAALANGYILPPLPVTDEQRAMDEAHAKELGVEPVLREPGETDEEYNVRLAASPRIQPVAIKPDENETVYPSHVDKPAFAPVVHGANEDALTD